MNRRSAIRFLTFSSAGFLLRLGGQDTVPQTDSAQDFTIKTEARLVLLDVSVRDHSGRFVPDLPKESFIVMEDGKPQEVTAFAGNDVPVTVGILVDESYSMNSKRPDVLTAALTFIGAGNPQDEIFVINFNDRVKFGLPSDVPFSDNIQQLSAALDRGAPEGTTRLYDATLEGLRKLELGHRGKKALLVISDGGDNASESTRAQMLEAVQRTVATIYTVGIFGPEDRDKDPGILKQMARISGGEAFFPATVPDTIPVCRGIAKEIRSRYTIGYVPQSGKPGGALRRIQVTVSSEGKGKLSAHTRESYRYVDDSKDRAEH
jgi:Ca-activated chloride channel family protein